MVPLKHHFHYLEMLNHAIHAVGSSSTGILWISLHKTNVFSLVPLIYHKQYQYKLVKEHCFVNLKLDNTLGCIILFTMLINIKYHVYHTSSASYTVICRFVHFSTFVKWQRSGELHKYELLHILWSFILYHNISRRHVIYTYAMLSTGCCQFLL